MRRQVSRGREFKTLFQLDIRLLEQAVTDWEVQHIKQHGTAKCSNVDCVLSYNIMRVALELRITMLKERRTIDLFSYEKQECTITDEGVCRHKISGTTIRMFGVGDDLILLSDIPDVDCRYRVIEVVWKPEHDNEDVHFFDAVVEFYEFELPLT